MAVTSTTTSIKVNVVLSNGTNANGTVKTINLSLGSLDKDAFNADKAMAIIDLLEPCLEKTRLRVEKHETSSLTSSN